MGAVRGAECSFEVISDLQIGNSEINLIDVERMIPTAIVLLPLTVLLLLRSKGAGASALLWFRWVRSNGQVKLLPLVRQPSTVYPLQ